MDTNHSDKLRILEEIRRRLNGNVIISTKTKKDINFCVDDLTTKGLSSYIGNLKVGGDMKTIKVSAITEIKELTGEILYPKG